MGDPNGEVRLDGWKVFVSAAPGGGDVTLDAVTDDLPLHRMTFTFSPEEAFEIADSFRTAASIAATEGCQFVVGEQHGEPVKGGR